MPQAGYRRRAGNSKARGAQNGTPDHIRHACTQSVYRGKLPLSGNSGGQAAIRKFVGEKWGRMMETAAP
jgi:hypothetical protein